MADDGFRGFSSLLNKLLFAPRTSDGNFSFAPGHANLLMAAGTVVISVLPILQLFQALQKFPILLIPLIGIPGQHTEDRPAHKEIICQHHQQTEGGMGDKQGNQPCDNTGCQNYHIQFIAAVAAGHKPTKAVPQPPHHIAEKVHVITFRGLIAVIIFQKYRISTTIHES